MKTITIWDITEWERDNIAIKGDASHEGYKAVMPLVYKEEEEIDEKGWPNLPFYFVTDTEDEEKAVSEAIDEYAAYNTDYHYFRPTEVDYDVENN